MDPEAFRRAAVCSFNLCCCILIRRCLVSRKQVNQLMFISLLLHSANNTYALPRLSCPSLDLKSWSRRRNRSCCCPRTISQSWRRTNVPATQGPCQLGCPDSSGLFAASPVAGLGAASSSSAAASSPTRPPRRSCPGRRAPSPNPCCARAPGCGAGRSWRE